MRRLEVPHAPAGRRIESEQTVGEQVVAGTVGAVEIADRRPRRDVNDAALLIEREAAPAVGGAGILPAIGGPIVVAELARMWNRVKGPAQLAGVNVERPDVA